MKHFTAVNTLLVSTKRTKKGGFANVKFQLTSKITKALDWPDMPEGTAEWCPDVDELVAQNVEFVPNNPELNHNAVSVEAQSIGDFVVVRKRKKEGKNSVKADKVITEVLCLIRFQDPTGCAKLEQYMQGARRSEMRVSYTPHPQQDELPGTRVDVTGETDLPLLGTAEAREAANSTPETDSNAEYVERAKERMKRERPAKNVQ